MNPSSTPITRREALVKTAGIGAILAGLPAFMRGADAPSGKKKVLFFTKSSGYEHTAIKEDGKPADGYGDATLKQLCSGLDIDLTISKDGSLFTPDYLAGFDGYVFYTTGDLLAAGTDKHPGMSREGKQALLDAIKGGKGFIGLHSASDTFHTNEDVNTTTQGSRAFRYKLFGDKVDPYIAMLGGEFIIHGKQQESTARIIDNKFPGFENLGSSFRITEEWYTLKDFRPDLHVLILQDTAGMEGPMYQRPPYPSTWAHLYGKGRVFYTSLGHRDDVWASDRYHSILTGAFAWTLGRVDADVTPNLASVAPGADKLPPVPAA